MAKIKLVILGIGITIVLAFFFGYGIDTFYKSPKYEDFCGERGEFKNYNTQAECEANNGKWNPYDKPVPIREDEFLCMKGTENEDGSFNLICDTKDTVVDRGFCDVDYYCREEFDDVREPYNRNVFVMCVVLGLIAIVLGTYLKLTSVSAGIMGGGVLTIIYGSIRYWADMNEYFRFIILAIALAILIWIGYKKFKK